MLVINIFMRLASFIIIVTEYNITHLVIEIFNNSEDALDCIWKKLIDLELLVLDPARYADNDTFLHTHTHTHAHIYIYIYILFFALVW